MSKTPEDMTMQEMKEQLAIYNRLYSHKRNKDDAYVQKKRESAQRHSHKKINEYEETNNVKLKPDESNDELLSEMMNAKEPFKAKRGTPKSDMSNFKITMPITE